MTFTVDWTVTPHHDDVRVETVREFKGTGQPGRPPKPFDSLYELVDTHWLWCGSKSHGSPAYQGGSATRFAYQREFDVELGSDKVIACRAAPGCVNPHHARVLPCKPRRTPCVDCGKDRDQAAFEGVRRVCRECRATRTDPEFRNAERNSHNARLRLKVLKHYGGSCACCGETNEKFLAMDHVNDDGADHRKETRYSNLYSWLNANGMPPGFQVLCHNCNYAKSRGGCPHGSVAGQPGGRVVEAAS